MFTRIVKMTFEETKRESFIHLFEEVKSQIRAFEGCTYLELLRDKNNPNIFFTYSKWEEEENLQAYRHSALFASTWEQTKAMFADKPEAWSVDSMHVLS